MDNDSYKQEFIKNVKQANQSIPLSRRASQPNHDASLLPMIISIILGIIVLVESVALAIFAINYGEVLDLYGDAEPEYTSANITDSPEALSANSNITYNDDYGITAFDLTCTAEDNSKYIFTKSSSYQKVDSDSTITDSGTYSIINSGAVVLSSSTNPDNKTVYYDGNYIMEDLTFYTCEDI